MHELSVAQSILDLVRRHVPPDRAADVRAVHVRVGALSGVLADSLEFCFSAVAADSPCPAAYLVIERVPIGGVCLDCDARVVADGPLPTCPTCGSARVHVVTGTDLQVTEAELEEPAGVAS